MGTRYYPLASCAADIARRLESLGEFRLVRCAALGSYEQLTRLIPDICELPAAIVCLTAADYEDDRSCRLATPGVVVLDRLELTAPDRAVGLWRLTDAVLAAFEPSWGRDGDVIINDNIYSASSARSLALGGDLAAVLVELAVTMPLRPTE